MWCWKLTWNWLRIDPFELLVKLDSADGANDTSFASAVLGLGFAPSRASCQPSFDLLGGAVCALGLPAWLPGRAMPFKGLILCSPCMPTDSSMGCNHGSAKDQQLQHMCLLMPPKRLSLSIRTLCWS
jgi:hypothetical protein